MSKFAKYALLAPAAFLVLGFSITASAGNPWLADKEQLINSGPIYGQFPICMVTNTTDSAVYVDIEMTWSLVSTMVSGASTPAGLNSHPSGEIEVPANGVAIHYAFPNELAILYCTIGWDGRPGEIRGTLCLSANTVGPIDCKDAY
jgi:hypothetical protein